MTRFDPRIGAGVLVGLGLIYLVGALATGHSARANVPPDLSVRAAEAGVEPWRAAGLLVREPGALVVDVRSAEEYRRWHVAGSRSAPSADAAALRRLAGRHPTVIVVAATDEAARKLVGVARRSTQDRRLVFLQGGARAWYLAFELPVPLFSESPPPPGYEAALRTVRAFLARPTDAGRKRALDALGDLARLNVQPTLLRVKGQGSQAPRGARKKISGGCG